MAKLITAAQMTKLLSNGAKSKLDPAFDPKPVLKVFNPTGAATWLITEIDPENPDIMFGLADMGFGTPELGSISLSEISKMRGRFNLPMERDIHFTADKPLSGYASAARAAGRIVA